MNKSELEKLIGEQVLLMCAAFFYTGKLIRVTATEVVLEHPAIVFDTGEWKTRGYAVAEKMPQQTFCICKHAIESFGESK